MTPRSLRELEATFVKIVDDRTWQDIDIIGDADGLRFLCPVCFDDPPAGPVGCHQVVCWQPHVGQEHTPRPGRWRLVGTSLDDLSLVAGSSSIHIQGGCNAHFFVRNGRVTL